MGTELQKNLKIRKRPYSEYTGHSESHDVQKRYLGNGYQAQEAGHYPEHRNVRLWTQFSDNTAIKPPVAAIGTPVGRAQPCPRLPVPSKYYQWIYA